MKLLLPLLLALSMFLANCGGKDSGTNPPQNYQQDERLYGAWYAPLQYMDEPTIVPLRITFNKKNLLWATYDSYGSYIRNVDTLGMWYLENGLIHVTPAPPDTFVSRWEYDILENGNLIIMSNNGVLRPRCWYCGQELVKQ